MWTAQLLPANCAEIWRLQPVTGNGYTGHNLGVELRAHGQLWGRVDLCELQANQGYIVRSYLKKEKESGIMNKRNLPFVFETRFQVSQVGLELTMWPRMIPNVSQMLLLHLSAGIIGVLCMYHMCTYHAPFM